MKSLRIEICNIGIGKYEIPNSLFPGIRFYFNSTFANRIWIKMKKYARTKIHNTGKILHT